MTDSRSIWGIASTSSWRTLVIVEVKAVEAILPVHEAQLLTYLRLSGKRVGLLDQLQCSAPEGRNPSPHLRILRAHFKIRHSTTEERRARRKGPVPTVVTAPRPRSLTCRRDTGRSHRNVRSAQRDRIAAVRSSGRPGDRRYACDQPACGLRSERHGANANRHADRRGLRLHRVVLIAGGRQRRPPVARVPTQP